MQNCLNNANSGLSQTNPYTKRRKLENLRKNIMGAQIPQDTMNTTTNHKTASILEFEERGSRKRSGKRKNKIDQNLYCPVLENIGRHIFDVPTGTPGKPCCRYCNMDMPK